jgi:DNA-directed RNA polymerase subunit RPC12/RpoP
MAEAKKNRLSPVWLSGSASGGMKMSANRSDASPANHRQAMKAAQKKLDELYKSLGVRTYACMKELELGLPELNLIKAEIDETMRVLDESAAEIERIKATKQVARGASCPQCGMKAPAGSVACPYCGTRILEPAETPPAKVELVNCPHCEGEITADAVFCGLCGKPVAEPAAVAPVEPAEAMSVEQASMQSLEVAPAPPPPPPLESAPAAASNGIAVGDKVVRIKGVSAEDVAAMAAIPAEPAGQPPRSDTALRNVPPSQPRPPALAPIPIKPATPVEKKCPECGEVQRRAAAFCFSCGERLGS